MKKTSALFLIVLLVLNGPISLLAQSHNFVYEDKDFESSPEKRTSSQKFIDKWLINGCALGSSIGSIVGVFVFQTFFPGPIGLIAGTLIGGCIGGMIGSYIDDRNGEAINYASFKRPPLTKGGMWLKNAGPWEQFMYQVDLWGLNGGSIASSATHIGLTTLARCIPGVGPWLSPLAIGVADYAAAVIVDNVDGKIDLADVGRKWDEENKAKRATSNYRDNYKTVIESMSGGDREAQRRAFEAYRSSYAQRPSVGQRAYR